MAALLPLAAFVAVSHSAEPPKAPMQLSVTVDFPDDITKGPFDATRLDAVMATIQDIGARRVNWMYYGEVTADDPRRGNIWDGHW